ncbi:nitrilase family protein [Bacteroides sp.]|uniref:nitrilase family protein n=1 Tax=Bacteroides sp. TaxID=29523 RepID=UPI0023BFD540|nr:nitrilase family protein [Bacteroides sp.]MDE6217008.1 nitrilase family protein [Bacteroides sp.]
MDALRISILQTDIVWENKQENLRRLRERLKTLCGTTEIVVLPEMFSTGFSMDTARLAEPVDGETIRTLRHWCKEFQLAITGSYIACETTAPETNTACSLQEKSSPEKTLSFFNRAFFLTPEGDAWYYDKRHLFRMGRETEHFTAGNQRPIISYFGWNIRLLVCYDLRFPVWSRNTNQAYDLLIYVANWPASRRKVWDVLLQARALENQSYVCGVNRIGTDPQKLPHNGGSVIYSPKGKLLASVPDDEEGAATAVLNRSTLTSFREKFPVWKDADSFSISADNS